MAPRPCRADGWWWRERSAVVGAARREGGTQRKSPLRLGVEFLVRLHVILVMVGGEQSQPGCDLLDYCMLSCIDIGSAISTYVFRPR